MIVSAANIIYHRYLMSKYEQTKLNISAADLKDNWGKPDLDFICKSCSNDRVLLYSHNLGLTEYVFKFNKNSGLLSQKYVGD